MTKQGLLRKGWPFIFGENVHAKNICASALYSGFLS